MSYAVTYYCPHCERLAELKREGYLEDKSVTSYPLEGWTYASPTDSFEDADGVRFVCGESDGVDWHEGGCGEPFYLNFVRFERGEEVEPTVSPERIELNLGTDPETPRSPDGPSGPDGW